MIFYPYLRSTSAGLLSLIFITAAVAPGEP
jgi:hypothetical protein